MSNHNKALLIAVALLAFIIGAAINAAKVSRVLNVSDLLNAELLTNDQQVQTAKQHLNKITLINFWASWCAPCRQEMPLFQSVYEAENKNGFNIVGIAIDDPTNAEPMLDSMGITYPNLYAEQTGHKLMELSGNEYGAMPYSILLDQDGVVIDQKLGEIKEHELRLWTKGKPIEGEK